MAANMPHNTAIRTDAQETPKGEVRVWDLGLRLFHWLLVAGIATALLTGFFAPEWWLSVHVWAGYGIAGLALFRIVWGFAGPGPARFANFPVSPRQVLTHIRHIWGGNPLHFAGHNPLGALMVFGLIGVIALILLSGMVGLGGQENLGFLAGFVPYRQGAAALELHEVLSFVLLAMIGLHVSGVAAESLLSRSNLVRAMITGRKPAHDFADHGVLAPASMVKGALVLAAAFALVGLNIWDLSRKPASGFITISTPADYASECGDCHHAYHPSLLPAASWRGIMAGLEDHFGEDASLEPKAVREISDWLVAHASENWDTEAANNLRRVSAENPWRITASPYWVRRHQGLDAALFKAMAVGSKGNCIACHQDASLGRFEDRNINLPTTPNS